MPIPHPVATSAKFMALIFCDPSHLVTVTLNHTSPSKSSISRNFFFTSRQSIFPKTDNPPWFFFSFPLASLPPLKAKLDIVCKGSRERAVYSRQPYKCPASSNGWTRAVGLRISLCQQMDLLNTSSLYYSQNLQHPHCITHKPSNTLTVLLTNPLTLSSLSKKKVFLFLNPFYFFYWSSTEVEWENSQV